MLYTEITQTENKTVTNLKNKVLAQPNIKIEQHIYNGINKELAEFKIRLNLLKIVLRHFKSPIKIINILLKLDKIRRKVLGQNRLRKLVKANGKLYWDLYTPGCESYAFDRYIEGEINRITPIKSTTNRFINVFLAITKKCSLKCEHCYEWESLNLKETLSYSDLKSIVEKVQEKGVGQIQFTGGEPLLRIDDLIRLIETASVETEFWINTSGHKLTLENARRLKDAGLNGVVISLDHFDKDLHNSFRGNKYSFDWVQNGVQNSIANNLVVGLSICVTRSFVSKKNLLSYAQMAKAMKVSFIQILEPKPVGHYKNKDVLLNNEQLKLLEEFYIELNYNKRFKDYPIITYHGFHQRKLGCFAAGNRSFYIDTDGDIHACPFCQKKSGNVLDMDFDTSIESLLKFGCHSFEEAKI